MAISNWWDQWTQTSKASAHPKQTLQSNGLSLGQSGGAGMTISPNGTLTVSGTTSSNSAGSSTYTNASIPSSWANATTTAGSSYWDSTWNSNAPLIDAMRELLVSLGFVENLVEHTYELDLKTKVRIPVNKIADIPQSQAQIIIGQYLDEMKSKIIEQVTDKILINRLIDTEKKDKNIKEC